MVFIFPTRYECNITSSPLVSSVVFQAVLLGSYDPILKQEEYSFGNSYLDLREKNIRVYFTSSPLVSSVVLHLLHSFRV